MKRTNEISKRTEEMVSQLWTYRNLVRLINQEGKSFNEAVLWMMKAWSDNEDTPGRFHVRCPAEPLSDFELGALNGTVRTLRWVLDPDAEWDEPGLGDS